MGSDHEHTRVLGAVNGCLACTRGYLKMKRGHLSISEQLRRALRLPTVLSLRCGSNIGVAFHFASQVLHT